MGKTVLRLSDYIELNNIKEKNGKRKFCRGWKKIVIVLKTKSKNVAIKSYLKITMSDLFTVSPHRPKKKKKPSCCYIKVMVQMVNGQT